MFESSQVVVLIPESLNVMEKWGIPREGSISNLKMPTLRRKYFENGEECFILNMDITGVEAKVEPHHTAHIFESFCIPFWVLSFVPLESEHRKTSLLFKARQNGRAGQAGGATLFPV